MPDLGDISDKAPAFLKAQADASQSTDSGTK
jgi:hypothetical protein